jgi:hypothetical protein
MINFHTSDTSGPQVHVASRVAMLMPTVVEEKRTLKVK